MCKSVMPRWLKTYRVRYKWTSCMYIKAIFNFNCCLSNVSHFSQVTKPRGRGLNNARFLWCNYRMVHQTLYLDLNTRYVAYNTIFTQIFINLNLHTLCIMHICTKYLQIVMIFWKYRFIFAAYSHSLFQEKLDKLFFPHKYLLKVF